MVLTLTACSGGSLASGGNGISSSMPDDDVQRALTPISSINVQNYNYKDIEKMFIDAGFTNVSIAELYDIDPDTDDSIFINNVSIGGITNFGNSESFPIDAAISVVCHRPYDKHRFSRT